MNVVDVNFEKLNDAFYIENEFRKTSDKDQNNPSKHWIYRNGIYQCGNCYKPATVLPQFIKDLVSCPYCQAYKSYIQRPDGSLEIMRTPEEIEERSRIVNMNEGIDEDVDDGERDGESTEFKETVLQSDGFRY